MPMTKHFGTSSAFPTAPVVASHSCCRALSPHHRNMSDDMLKALAKNGGVIGINFSPGFLNAEIEKKQNELLGPKSRRNTACRSITGISSKAEPEKGRPSTPSSRTRLAELQKTLPPVDVKTLVDHIDHVVKVTGNADHVGLGSDFDGISDDPGRIGKYRAASADHRRNFWPADTKKSDVRKILGGNFLRVFDAVQRAAEKVGRIP